MFEVRIDINEDCTEVSWTNIGNGDVMVEMLDVNDEVISTDVLEPGETIVFAFDASGSSPPFRMPRRGGRHLEHLPGQRG